MSVARILNRASTTESVFSETGLFRSLSVSLLGPIYSGNYGEIQLGRSSGSSQYLPAAIRGVDATQVPAGVFLGRVSFYAQLSNTLKEITWVGAYNKTTATPLEPDQFGLYTRSILSNTLDGRMGLTNKEPEASPAITTGQSYYWNTQRSGLADTLSFVAYNNTAATSTITLETFTPIGAAPYTGYNRAIRTQDSWLVNAGQATMPAGPATSVDVALPNITATSLVLLQNAFNIGAGSLWYTVPVNGTLRINVDAPLGAPNPVNWFVIKW